MLGCILTNNNLKGVSIMDYAILDKINELSDKLDQNKSVRWLTISDVCDYLHLSQSTIRRKIQSGEIKCSRKFGKILVDSAWLERWLNG